VNNKANNAFVRYLAPGSSFGKGEEGMQQQIPKGIRKRSAMTFCGLPMLDIAFGPDPDNGEIRVLPMR
jgi:hypothetical protein